ncbi:putative reverse transcriptase domain-containing protein [Tanacetum coccineum]
MITHAFVEANYEILESILRDRLWQIRNEDLRTELEYFSEDYDEEREMEPRPERTREVTPPLRTRSPKVCRQRERVVGFEEAPNKEGSRIGRNTEGNRPSKAEVEENGRQEINLPPLLAALLGRNKNGQPLQSSLTSVHEGRQSSINIGGNLPPNGIINGKTLSFSFQAQTGNPSVGGTFVYPPQGGQSSDHTLASKIGSRRRTWQFTTSNKEKMRVSELSPLGGNALQDVTCFGCGEKGHYMHKCPKGRNQQNKGARARAYMVVENPQQNPNVVTEKLSTEFTPYINIAPVALSTSYEVELADGKVVSTNTVLRGCTLALFNYVFKIDLLPTRLGSFDVIIGMDWLSYHQAGIVCYEKIVCIPLLNGKILKIQGERPEKNPRSLSCIKADEKKLNDLRIVCEFPKVFPDNLTGLPPVREIEFRIDLILGALPVVKSPYRLAPSEMLC